VECLTFETFCGRFGIQSIDILKVDVEDAEHGILRDAKARAIMAEVNDGGGYTTDDFARDVAPLLVRGRQKGLDTVLAIAGTPAGCVR
jgi:hypothetical protein